MVQVVGAGAAAGLPVVQAVIVGRRRRVQVAVIVIQCRSRIAEAPAILILQAGGNNLNTVVMQTDHLGHGLAGSGGTYLTPGAGKRRTGGAGTRVNARWRLNFQTFAGADTLYWHAQILQISR